MHFIISYLDSRGHYNRLRVNAKSVQQARLECRIPERRLLAVREDRIGAWLLRWETGVPGMQNQAIFLQNLSSSLAAGRPIGEAVRQLVKQSKWLKVKPERLNQCQELADYLRLFNFDRNTILLAQTGQRTGQYAMALERAAQYLLDRERLGAEVQKDLHIGTVYLICGLIFLTGLPFFMEYAIGEIRQAVGSEFQGNVVTKAVLFWQQLIVHSWPLWLVAALVFWRYGPVLVRVLKHAPGIGLMYYHRLLDRAHRFINAYELLHGAGIVDSQALLALLEAADAEDRKVYQRIYARLANSEDLAVAFNHEDWPLALRDVMAVLPDIAFEEKLKVIKAVKTTISVEYMHVSRALASRLARSGFLLMLVSVIASAIGFYVPLANMATALGL